MRGTSPYAAGMADTESGEYEISERNVFAKGNGCFLIAV